MDVASEDAAVRGDGVAHTVENLNGISVARGAPAFDKFMVPRKHHEFDARLVNVVRCWLRRRPHRELLPNG